MRIRYLLLLLIMALSMSGLSAVVSTQSLDIKAYKNYAEATNEEGYIGVYITDAMTDSLEVVAENDVSGNTNATTVKGRDMDITSYMKEPVLGEVSSNPSISEENILFSYRVVGNLRGRYTINFNITPFNGSDNNSRIDAAYKLVNETLNFHGYGSLTFTEPGEHGDIWTLAKNNGGTKSGSTAGGSSMNISAGWTLTQEIWDNGFWGWGAGYEDYSNFNGNDFDRRGNPDFDTTPYPWYARGSVAIVVDKEGYEKAPDGEYRATCTVEVRYE